jgi:hypothetical protein
VTPPPGSASNGMVRMGKTLLRCIKQIKKINRKVEHCRQYFDIKIPLGAKDRERAIRHSAQ